MKTTVCTGVFSRTSVAIVWLAGLAACGSSSDDRVDGGGLDAAPTTEAGSPLDSPLTTEAGRWPAEVAVTTCQDFASLNVGSYTVQANYWNKDLCPGTQCMEINKSTAAFTVTQGPSACGDTVATYPNVLYGCSFGNCSPGSMLPMPVSALETVTSSWDFSVGGKATDQYNVSYDIWFCPDDNCGTSGFPKGVELLIWLDYKNVDGWKTNLGTVTLAGHTWELWQATMGTGANSWTYLAYMIQAPMVTSVTDLDLNAFFKDAAARGYIQDSWYLYAIQAGTELRTGGVPFNHNSYSVTINGITPTTAPVTPTDNGATCDGGVPSASGKLEVSDAYVTAGLLHGYGSAWGWVGDDSEAVACAAPRCTAPGSLQTIAVLGNGVAPRTTEPVTCTPAFPPTALCTSGTVTADPTYNQVAGVGFNLNQGRAAAPDAGADGDADVDADADAGSDGGNAGALGTITIPKSITVSVAKSGTLTGNASLRVQLADADNNFYCYGGQLKSGEAIPIRDFNTKCWNNSGKSATATTPIKRVDVVVPGSASSNMPFAFCITDVTIQ